MPFLSKRWSFLSKRSNKTQVAEPTAKRRGIGDNQKYVTLEELEEKQVKTQQIFASVAVFEELDGRPKAVVLTDEALEGTGMSEGTLREGTYFKINSNFSQYFYSNERCF